MNKKTMYHGIVVVIVMTFFGKAYALDATSAGNLATALLGQIGKTRGLVEMPAAGDGQLALAFIQRSQMTVHAMSPDTAGVRTIRRLLEPTGVVGTQAYVEKGTPATIQLATNYADLIIITNVTDAGLGSIPVNEIVRALIPGGKAFVGRAASEGAGISTSALNSWITGRNDATVTTDAQGTWAVITRKKPSNVDEWTHNLHDAGNTWFSADSAFKWPPMQQWRQKPYVGQIRLGNTVAGGGRLYSVLNEGHGGIAVLRAYNIYNGQRLWKRTVGSYAGWQPDTKGAMMVAVDSGVYVINRNKIDFIVESGSVARSLTFDAQTRNQVTWLGIAGSLLYALGGDSANFKTGLGELHADALWYGNTIKAFDMATGNVSWTHTEPGLIESRRIGIAGGKVFFITKDTRAAALNALTGAQVWENRNASVVAMISGEGSGGSNDNGVSGLICSPTTIINNLPTDANVVALSAADGSLLWSTGLNTYPYNRPKMLMGDGTLITSSSDATKRAWNILTNQTVAKFQNLDWASCGTYSGSWNMLLAQHEVYNLVADQRIQDYSAIKGSCGTPMFVSNGLAIQPRNTDCECPRIRALFVECPADTFTFNRAAVQAERLEAGPANADLTAQVTADSLDWFTHRANLNRSGCAQVDVAASPNLIWRNQRAFPYDVSIATCVDTFDALNTPAVTAGTLAWWGGSDGYIRCYDMQNKSERWNFSTGGRIYAAPTVANGCVYAGSMDGYAYCLEAHTGRMVWRFRGAPVQRRINLYGQLSSTWPVITGIVVNGGNAYFAAGYDEGYGTHVYALNARTGAIVWQNNTAGAIRDKGNLMGFAPNGFMTIVKNKLWIRSTNGRPGVFDLTTGVFEPLQAAYVSADNRGCPGVRGKEIGAVLGRAVIQGSAYPWADHSERGRNLGDRTLNQIANVGIDANGLPVYPQVNPLMACVRAPAWDAADFVTASWGTTRLEKWSTSRMLDTCDALRAAFPPSTFANWQTMNIGSDWHNVKWGLNAATPLATSWIFANADVNAIALARNAVVVTQAKNTGAAQGSWTWWLSILSRSTATVLWETQLPGIPLQEGLSIARDGTILVSFKNGDVYGYGTGTPVSIANLTPRPPLRHGEGGSTENQRGAGHTSFDGYVILPSPGAGNGGVRASDLGTVLVEDKDATTGFKRIASSGSMATPGSEPLSTNMATLRDGSKVPMFAVTPADPDKRIYRKTDMAWHPGRECLPVASVSASSSARPDGAANTVDRKLTSRWQPSETGNQWLTYDLGSVQSVAGAGVVWYSRRAGPVAYQVEVSSDGVTFVNVDKGSLAGRGTNTLTSSFDQITARFVRVSIQSAGAAVSVYEVGIFGEAKRSVASGQ